MLTALSRMEKSKNFFQVHKHSTSRGRGGYAHNSECVHLNSGNSFQKWHIAETY